MRLFIEAGQLRCGNSGEYSRHGFYYRDLKTHLAGNRCGFQSHISAADNHQTTACLHVLLEADNVRNTSDVMNIAVLTSGDINATSLAAGSQYQMFVR